MGDLIRNIEYGPGSPPGPYKHELNARYSNFEVTNRGPYELLVKWGFDDTTWLNADTVVKPWATQNLTALDPTDQIMLYADPDERQNNPEGLTPKYTIFASDTGRASTPAYTGIQILQALRAQVEEVSPTLVNSEEAGGFEVIRLRTPGDSFDRVVVDNLGELAVGDGASAPQSVGRLAGLSDIPPAPDLSAYLEKSGGALSGPLNLNDNVIAGLADPEGPEQAVNWRTLEQHVNEEALLKQGGNLTGSLDMNRNPIAGLADPEGPEQAVNWRTLEQHVNEEALLKQGGNLTGSLDMNGNPIAGLADPGGPAQAANQLYVDEGDAHAENDAVARALSAASSLKSNESRPTTSNWSGAVRAIRSRDGRVSLSGTIQNTSGRPLGSGTAIRAATVPGARVLGGGGTFLIPVVGADGRFFDRAAVRVNNDTSLDLAINGLGVNARIDLASIQFVVV